jgi:hypothetical protein
MYVLNDIQCIKYESTCLGRRKSIVLCCRRSRSNCRQPLYGIIKWLYERISALAGCLSLSRSRFLSLSLSLSDDIHIQCFRYTYIGQTHTKKHIDNYTQTHTHTKNTQHTYHTCGIHAALTGQMSGCWSDFFSLYPFMYSWCHIPICPLTYPLIFFYLMLWDFINEFMHMTTCEQSSRATHCCTHVHTHQPVRPLFRLLTHSQVKSLTSVLMSHSP